jgi:isopenicillin N synthase-like dioxygenase
LAESRWRDQRSSVERITLGQVSTDEAIRLVKQVDPEDLYINECIDERIPEEGDLKEGYRIGAGAHSDYGCLALLAQDDKGGLQVRDAARQRIDAKPVPGTFVVNVGDVLARWINDLFPPTLHRVINTSAVDRQSIPFLYDPNHDAPVEVIPTVLREGEEPKYPPTTSLAHLQERFGATLAHPDESLVESERKT